MKTIKAGGAEYQVMTDREADEAVKAYILDSLWAFNASFILNFLGIHTPEAEKSLQSMQEKSCESANPMIMAMIKGREQDFVDEAVSADGRGHFLSGYDGEELQAGDEMEGGKKVGKGLFAYRTN